MTAGAVRAVVVDDSPSARALLEGILEDGGVQVVGVAGDGATGVALVHRLRPDVVVMDIHMPEVDGFEATRRIMAEAPTPIVIVTAGYDPGDVAVSLQATRVGALTVLPKPAGPGAPSFEAEAARLVAMVRAMADVKVIGRRGSSAEPARQRTARPGGAARVRAIAVGASTGGPAALYRFLEVLPAGLAAPVLVVQHIPDGFVAGLVRWLQTATSMPVRIAAHGDVLAPGAVLVAPHGHHLCAGPGERVRLSDEPPVGGFRPSVTPLLASVAEQYGSSAAAVVLTGMGNDGVDGARRVHERGGWVAAQDEATSVVFGMPKAVADAGVADLIGPVDELARRVGAMTCGPRSSR